MFAYFFFAFRFQTASVMNQSRVCSAPFFACSRRFKVNTYAMFLSTGGEEDETICRRIVQVCLGFCGREIDLIEGNFDLELQQLTPGLSCQ
jgi:hypothetical protein